MTSRKLIFNFDRFLLIESRIFFRGRGKEKEEGCLRVRTILLDPKGEGRERVTERSGGIIDFVFLNGSERIGANYRGRKLIVPVKVSGIRGWMRCPHKCAADNQWNQSINWHGIATRAARLISFHGQRHYTGENRPASA